VTLNDPIFQEGGIKRIANYRYYTVCHPLKVQPLCARKPNPARRVGAPYDQILAELSIVERRLS
jgi:hypothetical protein